MANIMQDCQTCQKKFLIIDSEQKFLQEKGIGFPKSCPSCRQAKRLFLRGNERKLYKTKCQKCGKEIIVAFDPSSVGHKIFCNEDYKKYYWEADLIIQDPLPKNISTEFFFKELKRIILSHPKNPTHTLNSENCDYGDQLYWCKNLINCFDSVNCSDSLYLFDCEMMANCIDCDFCVECDLIYESVDAHKCFNCEFLEDSYNILYSSYCTSCRDCHDVFGCVQLNSKSYCIFNRQLAPEEYRQQIKKYKSMAAQKILAILDDLKKRFPVTQAKGMNNENCPYCNYLYNSVNCYYCFDGIKNENCAYIYDSGDNKYCFDSTFTTECELSYEFLDSAQLFNCSFIIYSDKSQDSLYLVSCDDIKSSLGCVNLNHKQYCILNRQLNKEEYDRISLNILNQLKEVNLGWHNLIF